MAGELGAVGASAVHPVAVDSSSGLDVATLGTARDRQRAPGRVTRTHAKESGAVGQIGVPAQCHAGSAERPVLEIAYRRTSARESLWSTKCANSLAVTVSGSLKNNSEI